MKKMRRHHMIQTTQVLSLALVAWISLSNTSGTNAQETSTGNQVVAASAAEDLTLEEVQAQLAALEANNSIEETVKSLLRPKYDAAINELKQAAANNAKTAEYRDAINAAPATTAEVQALLQSLPSVEEAAKPTIPQGTAEDLQKKIDARKADLEGLKDQLSSATTALSAIQERPAEISARLPQAERELSERQTRLASPQFADDVSSPGRVADRLVLRGEQVQLQSELEILKQEQLSLSVRQGLLQAQQALLTRQVENSSATLDAIQTMMGERLASEVEQAGTTVSLQDLPVDDEEAQALFAEVQALTKEFKGVVDSRQQLTDAETDVKKRMEELNGEFDFVSQGLKSGSSGVAMAQVLFDLRDKLVNATAAVSAQSGQLATYDETRLTEFVVDKKLREHAGLKQQFADRTSAAISQLLTTRENVLNQLKTQYGNLVRDLAGYDGSRQQYLDKTNEVRAYIKEQVLWMRSSPVISATTLTEIPQSLMWEFSRKHVGELSGAAQGMGTQMRIFCVVIVLVVIILLILRRRISAALTRTGERVRRISTDKYARTWEAMFWTVLLAIPLPLTLGSAGWALAEQPEASGWLRGIAEGLQIAAWITFATSLMSAICRPEGLGDMHFRWPKQQLIKIRQAASSFAAVYIPLFLITCSTVYGDASHYFSSLGRLSLMLAHGWAVIVLWRLFNFSNGVLTTSIREHSSRPIVRLRYLWFPLMIACPLALVVLAPIGYTYTSLDLGLGLIFTAALIAGGVVFYSMAVRWFSLRTRRLAFAEALEERREREETGGLDEQPVEAGEVVLVEPDEIEPNLESVGQQTRQLLRMLFSLAVFIALVLFWSQTIPVFETFDRIPIPLAGGLTLLGLIKVVLIVVITFSVTQNLPAVLELAVLRETNTHPGTRKSIAILCQYGVVAIGLVLLAGVLDIDWTRFGWIAAALSVGLGFGLQEVVANFVCGLILLYERPIRVGDVVTLEGMTGTVTNIRMRSTTITNWDRQEFVVPNKNIITGTILNWTLSASVNRVVIPVGVAYGSDTELARQILLDVAAENSQVVDDPPAMTTFEAFADSSLTLTLRAYLPDVENRLKTITDLHTEIDKRFAEAGIEIAFPQHDLNLGDGWGLLHPQGVQGELSEFASSESSMPQEKSKPI